VEGEHVGATVQRVGRGWILPDDILRTKRGHGIGVMAVDGSVQTPAEGHGEGLIDDFRHAVLRRGRRRVQGRAGGRPAPARQRLSARPADFGWRRYLARTAARSGIGLRRCRCGRCFAIAPRCRTIGPTVRAAGGCAASRPCSAPGPAALEPRAQAAAPQSTTLNLRSVRPMSDTNLPDATLQSLLHAATLAPSSHNTQPWLFRIDASAVDLLADRTRALPVNDPDDRELTLSCGCALFNLRVAAAAAGLAATVQVFPDAADADLLARIRIEPARGPIAEAGWIDAIAARRTCRERFAATPIDAAALQALIDAAACEGAALVVLETEERRIAAAGLVAEGDAIQWADPSWRRELAAWMHPRRRGDGLFLPALAIPVAQLVIRTFDMGHGVGAKDRQLADESPVLAVLSTASDSQQNWLAAGQALQRLLLAGVQAGLQASFLNQPVQVAALRPQLQQLTGRPGCAQLLLRIGAPLKALPASARRPLAEVLVSR